MCLNRGVRSTLGFPSPRPGLVSLIPLLPRQTPGSRSNRDLRIRPVCPPPARGRTEASGHAVSPRYSGRKGWPWGTGLAWSTFPIHLTGEPAKLFLSEAWGAKCHEKEIENTHFLSWRKLRERAGPARPSPGDTGIRGSSRAPPRGQSSKAPSGWGGSGSRELQRVLTKAWRREEERRESFQWELWALTRPGDGIKGPCGPRETFADLHLSAQTPKGRFLIVPVAWPAPP